MSQQITNGNKFVRCMAAKVADTSDQDGDVIDTQGFETVAFLVAFGALTGGAITGLKVQQGALANGNDMADLKDSALVIADDQDGKCLLTEVYRPSERYVRVVVTRGTANAVVDGAFAILGGARVEPVAQDASIVHSELLISPAEGAA